MFVLLLMISRPFVFHKNLTQLLEKNIWRQLYQITDKWHLLISGHKYEHEWTQIGTNMVWEENQVKLLGITMYKITFDSRILNICLKANKKLGVLCRLKHFSTF